MGIIPKEYLYKERLLKKIKIDPVTNCWNWTGHIIQNGYGQTYYRGSHELAHRISFKLFKPAEFNPLLNICHRCDNRKCINPEHLFIGTKSDNMQDALSKGRLKTPNPKVQIGISKCPSGHLLTIDNVYTSQGHTKCKQCTKLTSEIQYYGR